MPDGSNSTLLEEGSYFWGGFFRLVSGCFVCVFPFGVEAGRQEGRKAGRQEGRKEGRKEGRNKEKRRREGKQKNLPKKMSSHSHIENVHMKKPLQ